MDFGDGKVGRIPFPSYTFLLYLLLCHEARVSIVCRLESLTRPRASRTKRLGSVLDILEVG
jgi:hypothetical protein